MNQGGDLFLVNSALHIESTPLSQAEQRGEKILIHPSDHVSYWETALINAVPGLRGKTYDFFPRSRVAYSIRAKDDPCWIIGYPPYLSDTRDGRNQGSDAVFPQMGFASELQVGLEGVGLLVLKGMRLDLVERTHTSAFLSRVQYDASACPSQFRLQLFSHVFLSVAYAFSATAVFLTARFVFSLRPSP